MVRLYGDTNTGRVRSSNQDTFIAGYLNDAPEKGAYIIVCDGMGGAKGGNVASLEAAECISGHIESSFRDGMSPHERRELLLSAIYEANTLIYNKSLENEALSGMGTTVVAAFIFADTTIIANIGDSRAYLVTDKLTCITKDHSMVQALVDAGEITEEQAKRHPNKNILLRVLGVAERADTDIYELKPEKGSFLLLCSDGLYNMVEDDELVRLIKQTDDMSTLPGALIETANLHGGIDNITACIAAFE